MKRVEFSIRFDPECRDWLKSRQAQRNLKVAAEMAQQHETLRWWATRLSAGMLAWVVGLQTLMELGVADKVAQYSKSPLSLDLLLKFRPHTAIRLTHHLGAVLWCVCAIIQLQPAELRNTYPMLHRRSGYVFFVSCAMLTVGFLLIGRRGLHADERWPLAAEHKAADIDPGKISLHAINAWFVATAAAAWYYAAVKRDFKAHQRMIYRHLAAGLWVFVQRLLYTMALPLMSIDPLMPAGVGVRERMFFSGGGALAIILCIGYTEQKLLSTSVPQRGGKAA